MTLFKSKGRIHLGDKHSLVLALVNQSRFEQLKKRHDASEQVLARIIAIIESEKPGYDLAPVYIHKAGNAIATGAELSVAREHALEAIRLAEMSGKRNHLEEATLTL